MICQWECTYSQSYKKIIKNLLALSEKTWNTNLQNIVFKNKTKKLYWIISKYEKNN